MIILTISEQRNSQIMILQSAKSFLKPQIVDMEFMEKIEEHLIKSGIHLDIVSEIMNFLVRKTLNKKNIEKKEIVELLKQKIVILIEDFAVPIDIDQGNLPQVIVICGINGSGKTTIIGKMAKLLTSLGWDIVIAACDTFRSAAKEQLRICSSTESVEFICREYENETPFKIAIKAYKIAREKSKDILIIDTAGRTHNNQNLMKELGKLKQKLNEISEDVPHNTILIIDANCGYSVMNQVEIFNEIIGITGFIVTKTDIAKNPGSVISVCKKFKIPIHGITDGETMEHIKDFEPYDFADLITKNLENGIKK